MNVWCVILAAGQSRRFGGVKALAHWRGQPLLSHAIATAEAACPGRTVVVTGGHAEALRGLIPAGREVHNADWPAGMGGSIAIGVRAVAARGAGAALLLPVDQPLVTTMHLKNLIEKLPPDRALLTSDGPVAGPPAIIPAALFPPLSRLTGHRGLKSGLAGYALLDGPGLLADIDTPADLARLA